MCDRVWGAARGGARQRREGLQGRAGGVPVEVVMENLAAMMACGETNKHEKERSGMNGRAQGTDSARGGI